MQDLRRLGFPPQGLWTGRRLAEQARPRIPRRFVWVVLGAARYWSRGALLEHVLDAGANPAATTTATTVVASSPSAAGSEHESVVAGEPAAFMGLNRMTPGDARDFSLVDERGQTVALADERSRVVVLTFFDGRCDDICPVLAEEIARSRRRPRDVGQARDLPHCQHRPG